MFDLSGLMLGESLNKARQKELIEAAQLEKDMKRNNLNMVLDGLAQQYKAIENSRTNIIMSRKRLTESATISAVRDVVYNIFEGALLLDDEPKAYYASTLREVFNAEFGKLLAENAITSLSSFKNHYNKSNQLVEAVLETATKLVQNNSDLYSNLLENYYGDIEVKKSISKVYSVLTEADATSEKKEKAITTAAEKLKEKILGADINGIIKYGLDVKHLLGLYIAAFVIGGALGVAGASIAVSAAVGAFIGLIDAILTNKYQQKHLPKYRLEIIGIRKDLITASQKLDKNSKEYTRIQSQIMRCNTLLNNIDIAILKQKQAGTLKETTATIGESVLDKASSLLSEACAGVESSGVNDFCSTLKDAIPELDLGNDTKVLLGSVTPSSIVNESGVLNKNELLKINSVLYEAVNSLKPSSEMPKSVHIALQEGHLPDERDFLDENDRDMLDTIANINGKDLAIDKVKEKVINVIENEEKRAKEKEEEQKAILNRMNQGDLNQLKDSVSESAGIKLGSVQINIPETLFESIVMNRSKKYIQESATTGTVDLIANKDTILSESIVLYTIHETFNTLNLKKYDAAATRKLMNDYYYNKI